VKKNATQLAANTLPIPIDERGEIYMAVLLASIDVAEYCMAWNATQRFTDHQQVKI
jgi:hypothetical protein